MLKDVNYKVEEVMYNYTLQQYVVWLYILILLDVLKEGS